MLRWFVLAGAVVFLDQTTKLLANWFLEFHVATPLAPFLNLTLTYNTGAAFSFLADAGGWQRWFFALVSAVVSVFIALWLRRIPHQEVWLPCALALVLGGAVGNLWDRLILGAGVDFIDVYYRSWHWPAFNIADSAISIGAGMLLVTAFRGEQRPEK